MKSLHRPVLLGLALFSLSACQLLPERDSAPPLSAPPPSEPTLPFTAQASPPQALDADLVYSYLVAEMAAQQGELVLAFQHYLRVADLAGDAYAAERATRIAAYLKDRAGALRAARRWVELSPNDRNARMSLALLLERDGRRPSALAELEALLQISAALEQDGFLQIGRVLAKEGAVALRPLMRDLVAAHPGDGRAQFALAVVEVAAKSLGEAEESLRKAVVLLPARADIRVMLARVRYGQGRPDEALAGLVQALEDMPDSRPLRQAYARMLVDAGRHAEALVQFRRLLDETPGDADLVYAVAMLAMHEQAWPEARRHWQVLRSMGGDKYDEASYFLGQVEERLGNDKLAAGLYGSVKDGDLLMDAGLHLARLEARQGKLAKARERLRNLRVLVPQRAVEAYLAEADLLNVAGQTAAARELFDEAVSRQPERVELRYARAMFAAEQDDLQTLESDLRHILSKDPDHVESLNALGYTLADRTDRHQEAFALIMRAYRLQPENAAILDSLGWVYYRLGDYANAIKYLRRALDTMMDDEIAAHLGEVLWVIGERDAARSVWQRGLARTPDSPHIHDVMQRLE